ncbi:MAG: dihydrolipoyl dehydrogenase [Deltaproteobacteria bacterium]
MANPYDVTIIGSGPGGYVAAIRAAQLGLRVALIEKDKRLGGTCLHRGCIPTKAMLFSAQLLDHAREGESFGLEIPQAAVKIEGVHRYKDAVVQKMAGGIDFLMKKNKVTVLKGHGRIAGPGKVTVTPEGGAAELLQTRATLIATGSVPRSIPGVDFDHERVYSSDDILLIQKVPKRLVVLGAGAVGVEFASIFRSYGSEVTIVEVMPRLLPIEDEDSSKEILKAFRRRKIECLLGAKLEKLEKTKEGVRLLVVGADGKSRTIEADLLLSAVGRRPLTDDVGLDQTQAKPDAKGFLAVDEMMRTKEPNVYAIGDVLTTPALAHVASAEGILAMEHFADKKPRPIDYGQIPSCTYSSPQVASIGLTEAKAREKGYDVKVGVFPFSALAKAQILHAGEGMVKIVAEKRYDEFLGIHLVGPEVTDLLAEGGVALKLESTVEEIARTIHAHPTLSEAVGEAAHAVLGHAIHI